jgi:hypothetical protein
MSIKNLFGFGKKAPFSAPREALQLRFRIESESKENFPHRERYGELARDAEAVFQVLDGIIAEKQHAEEAMKLQEDIRKKLATLKGRIQSNINEGKKETSKDYVEKKIDYLERKKMRDSAKDLYSEFLLAHEQFTDCFRQVRTNSCDTVDSASSQALRILSDLNENYFKPFGQDKDIQGIREHALKKVVDLSAVFETQKKHLNELGLLGQIEPGVRKLSAAAKELSAP